MTCPYRHQRQNSNQKLFPIARTVSTQNGGNPMKSILSLLTVTFFISTSAYAQQALMYKNVINKSMRCDNPNGNEIKEWKHISAPTGKYFDPDNTTVIEEGGSRSYTDAASPSGCFMKNQKWQTVFVDTKSGHKVPVSVLREFDIWAHADCGSGELVTQHHVLNNESITMICSASTQTYDLPDIK